MILRNRSDRIAAIAVVCWFVLAALVATQLGTWTDEEYTLATTAHGPAYAMTRALTYELQAPLYFVLEAVWREASPSLWWARLPSLLCIVGFFFTLRALGRRIVPGVDPLAFAALATLNPFVIYAGFEIRLYALALLFSGLMFLTFDAGFGTGSSARARIGFAAVTIAAIYVQYFLGFALVGLACALLVRGERRPLFAFALTCVPIVVAALPLALWAHSQIGGYETAPPTFSSMLRHNLLHPWLEFLFPYERDWDVVRWVHRIYDAVVAIVVISILAVRPRLGRTAWGWLACVVSIELTYLVLTLGLRVELDERHYVALFVPLAIAAYVVLYAVASGGHSRYRAIYAFSAVLTAAVLFTRYQHLALPGDWRRVGAYLTAAAQPGDVIVVYAADAAPAFARQYHGTVPIVPFPAKPSPNVYSADVLVVHSAAQADAALRALDKYAHVWFVSQVRCRPDELSYGCIYVQPAIDRNFTLERESDFYETRVEKLSAIHRNGRGKETAQP